MVQLVINRETRAVDGGEGASFSSLAAYYEGVVMPSCPDCGYARVPIAPVRTGGLAGGESYAVSPRWDCPGCSARWPLGL